MINLLHFYQPLWEALDEGMPIDVIYLDMGKACDTFPNHYSSWFIQNHPASSLSHRTNSDVGILFESLCCKVGEELVVSYILQGKTWRYSFCNENHLFWCPSVVCTGACFIWLIYGIFSYS